MGSRFDWVGARLGSGMGFIIFHLNFYQGCGTWTSTRVGRSGCYKHFKELKSWQEAREQCRDEGRSQGVSDADLAYFDDASERDDVMEGR